MSVAEEVENYVEKRPYIQDALSEEILNYSALARKIQEEVDGSHEAVKVALRRLKEKLRDQRKTRRTNIGKVMEGTSVKLEGNMQVCKSLEEVDGEVVAETENGFTAVQKSEKGCSGDLIEDQVLITLESPENLEETPGVLSYILSILGAKSINITELISCREDTHLVIDEDDATKTFELLNEKLKE
ncbi:hypothetical protein GLU60_00800 [Nanohaloarchaea archaeon H01]|nr:hypothetical protein [Nanohaloarchaea archaeon H01]